MFTLPFIIFICRASLIFVRPSFFKLLLVVLSMVPSAPIARGIISPVEHSPCANSLVIGFSYFFCFSSNRCFRYRADVSYGHVTSIRCRGHSSPVSYLVAKAPYHNAMLSLSISCSDHFASLILFQSF